MTPGSWAYYNHFNLGMYKYVLRAWSGYKYWKLLWKLHQHIKKFDFGNCYIYFTMTKVCLSFWLGNRILFPFSVSRTPFKSSCKMGCHPFWSQLFTPTFPVKNALMQTTWSTYQVSRLVNSSSQFVLQQEHVILQKYVWLSFRILFVYASLWYNCLAPPFLARPLLILFSWNLMDSMIYMHGTAD